MAVRFDGRVATRSLSYLVYLYPLIWSLGLREARQADRAASLSFLVAWSALLFVGTLFQRRFLDVFAVAFAIGCAWSVAATAARLRVRGSDASAALLGAGVAPPAGVGAAVAGLFGWTAVTAMGHPLDAERGILRW